MVVMAPLSVVVVLLLLLLGRVGLKPEAPHLPLWEPFFISSKFASSSNESCETELVRVRLLTLESFRSPRVWIWRPPSTLDGARVTAAALGGGLSTEGGLLPTATARSSMLAVEPPACLRLATSDLTFCVATLGLPWSEPDPSSSFGWLVTPR